MGHKYDSSKKSHHHRRFNKCHNKEKNVEDIVNNPCKPPNPCL